MPAVPLPGDDGGFTFRLWPLFSAAALRRKLLEALTCGSSLKWRKQKPHDSPARPAPSKRASGRLLELIAAESGSEAETDLDEERKAEVLEEMKDVVRRLRGGGEKEEESAAAAAEEVRMLAKDDREAREVLAMLGAIPSLVGMIDDGESGFQISTLYALLNVGVGVDVNKAAIVKAGALHKMLKLLTLGSPPSITDAIIANFLSLSALDSNKPIIGSSGAIPFLVKNCSNLNCSQSQHDSLRALYNLSLAPANTPYLVESGLVPILLACIGDMEITERALSVLSNMVSAPEGRRAISQAVDSYAVLVDVLNWTDSPSCQEKAAYILMVMAYKACNDRSAMVEAGIVSSLLELTLLGSALAQKRASRVLECLAVDKGKKQISESFDGGNCGEPGCSSLPIVSTAVKGVIGVELEREESVMSEERKAVKQLVQQSLQNNMRRIVKRANLPQDFAPSEHFRVLTATSTSKSLPF